MNLSFKKEKKESEKKVKKAKSEHHGNKMKIFLLVLVVLLLIIAAGAGYITDFLWFKELGYLSVFFKKLVTQLKIGIPVFLIVSLSAYLYFKFIRKGYYKKIAQVEPDDEKKPIRKISIGLSALFGAIVTIYATTNLWFTLLQCFNSTEFDLKDPLFNLDVSFYVFKMDFLKQINSLLIIVLAVFVILTLVYYAILMGSNSDGLFGKKKPDPFAEPDPFGGLYNDEARNYNNENDNIFNINSKFKVHKPNVKIDDGNMKALFSIASKQLITVGVMLFIMLAIHFVLKQFDLLHSHNGSVFGAGYTDIHVTLWMYRLLAVLSVIGAIAVVIGVKKHKVKIIAVIPIAMIVVNLIGVGAAIGVQSLVVSSNEIAKESKYLERNIEYTQKAYGIDNVNVKSFPADNKLTAKDIKNNDETISNIRINDYMPAEKFYNQTQSIRQYYTFKDVDVDRYMVNGDYTQTFLSAREIDEEKISQTWINKHLKYTHGYGITLSRVDEITESGQPKMMIDNIPPKSDVEEIKLTRPEIYFGEMTNEYVVVGTDEEEFDYPDGDSNKYAQYEGAAGIRLNMFNRILFAIKEKNPKILVSSNIDSNSRIVINRNISDRVRKIMPYLEYDKDPYIVTENGKLYWIIDAYTQSSQFPYSEPYDIQNTSTNYIRNSIKVVVDAYNGNVDYYIVDEEDPIAMSMKKIYPKLFKSGEEMPEELKSHIRYPHRMFETQAKVYSRYHMNDVRVFYQNEDLWDIAYEIYGTEEVQMDPNYFIMNLPGEKKAEFVNSIPFTPKDKKNMTGLMMARNDGEHYGELVVYKFPKSKVVYGPRQVEAQIDQDTEISKDFSLWSNAGSTYSRGNMFVIPIEDSLLYVEPVYLEASESSIPEVKRVIVVYGDEIAYEETLGEALNDLFGDGTAQEPSKPGETDGNKPQGGTSSNIKALINKANDAYDNAQEALKTGDFAKYGEYMDDLEKYLRKMK